MWAVLEHLYNPNDYIKYIYKILKPSGKLIIQVPKFNSFVSRILLCEDVPRHVSFYKLTWLINYIERYGFNVIKINTRCPIFYGSSQGFFRYFFMRLIRKDQLQASRNSFGLNSKKHGALYEIDLFLSKYLDKILRRIDYGGQMTVVFEKKYQ